MNKSLILPVIFLVITIIIVIVMIDYFRKKRESFQECNPSDPSIKGPIGEKGEDGKNGYSYLTEEKKQLVDQFLNDLEYRDGTYYVRNQKVGCYIP
jgi:hypothetical protein